MLASSRPSQQSTTTALPSSAEMMTRVEIAPWPPIQPQELSVPCLSSDVQLHTLLLHSLYQPLDDKRPICMGRKRKSAAVASPEPDSSRVNRIESAGNPKPDKRVKFEIPETLPSTPIDEPVSPRATTTTVSPAQLIRRFQRQAHMTEQSDDQWRDSGASEDWSGIENREERRRIQNRISQRKFSKSSPTTQSRESKMQSTAINSTLSKFCTQTPKPLLVWSEFRRDRGGKGLSG